MSYLCDDSAVPAAPARPAAAPPPEPLHLRVLHDGPTGADPGIAPARNRAHKRSHHRRPEPACSSLSKPSTTPRLVMLFKGSDWRASKQLNKGGLLRKVETMRRDAYIDPHAWAGEMEDVFGLKSSSAKEE